MKERDEAQRLKKFEDSTEAKIITQDVEQFNELMSKKKNDQQSLVLKHNEKLVKQIQDKKVSKPLNAQELLMNKQLLLEIQAQKTQIC